LKVAGTIKGQEIQGGRQSLDGSVVHERRRVVLIHLPEVQPQQSAKRKGKYRYRDICLLDAAEVE
jgi:hypothetical protein